MAFTLTFETDNAAFVDDDAGRDEVARILRELSKKIAHGSETSGGVYDANGNRVGKWTLDLPEDDDVCGECGAALDDGEGYDGKCGSCADEAEEG